MYDADAGAKVGMSIVDREKRLIVYYAEEEDCGWNICIMSDFFVSQWEAEIECYGEADNSRSMTKEIQDELQRIANAIGKKVSERQRERLNTRLAYLNKICDIRARKKGVKSEDLLGYSLIEAKRLLQSEHR